jgi:ribonuclease HII
LLTLERKLWDQGQARLAGLDEAGRGPLAGPVVASAVVLPRAFAEAEENGALGGLTDSKKLSASSREHFFVLLTNSPSVDIGVGVADTVEIDVLNFLVGTSLARARAVRALPDPPPGHILVDGLSVRGLPCPSTAIVGGDAKSLSIAAASVVAKVVRDEYMKTLDAKYPAYGLAAHKGYACREHVQALFEHGPAETVHRWSFRPVREAEQIRQRAARTDAGRAPS